MVKRHLNKVSHYNCNYLGIIFIILISFIYTSSSQTYLTSKYTQEEGLPSNRVYSIVQDNNGCIWIATKNGIVCYDGKKNRLYNDYYLSLVDYIQIRKDQAGRIWSLAMVNGLALSYFENNTWHNLAHYQVGYHPSDSYNQLTFDVESNSSKYRLVIGIGDRGLYICDNKSFRQVQTGINNLFIGAIKYYKNKFYIASNKGLFVIDENDKFYKLNFNFPNEVIGGLEIEQFDTKHNRLCIYGNGFIGYFDGREYKTLFQNKNIDLEYNMWDIPFKIIPGYFNSTIIASLKGIYIIDNNSGVLTPITAKNGLIDNASRDVVIDREKNIWVASDRGVSRISSMRFANYNINNGLLENETTSIVEQKPGKIIIGHNTGLSIINNGIVEKNIFMNDIRKDARVFDMALHPNGDVYIAAFFDGFYKLDKNSNLSKIQIPNELIPLASVHCEHDGTIYLLSRDVIYTYKSGNFTKFLNKNMADFRRLVKYNGKLYATTMGVGVIKIGDTYSKIIKSSNGTFNNVFDIASDNQGRIIVASNHGLGLIENDSIKPYPYLDYKKPIYFIKKFQDAIWLGTDNGVIRYYNKDNYYQFGSKDGLSGLETNRDAICEDSFGNLWIGTNRGLSRYNPNYDLKFTIKPIINYEFIDINGTNYYVNKHNNINLAAGEYSIRFNASVISFYDENRNSIIYYLEGYDKNWSNELNPKFEDIVFKNLPPGTYTLRVKAKNALGIWSDEIVFPSITINQPFYKSFYFYISIAIVTFILGYLIVNISSNYKYKNKLEVEVALRTAQLDESRRRYMQMYINNNAIMMLINTINGEIIEANPAASEFYGYPIEQISGKTIFDFLYERNFDKAIYLNNLYKSTEFQDKHIVKDGQVKDILMHISKLTLGETKAIFAIIENITERIQAEMSLIESRQEFITIVEHSPDIISRLDSEKKYLYINTTIEKVTGINPSEFIGKTNEMLGFDNSLVDNWNTVIDQVFNTGVLAIFAFDFTSQNKITYVFETYILPEFDTVGKVISVLAVNRDITDRKAHEIQIHKLNSELEERVHIRTKELETALFNLQEEIKNRVHAEEELSIANQKLSGALEREKEIGEMKNRFISMISHEYRTPLTVILSSAYLIKETVKRGLYEEVDKHLLKINASVNAMSRLLEDVLTFGKSAENKLYYNPMLFDLSDLINKIKLEIKSIDQDEHKIEYNNSNNPIQIESDQFLLRQVLFNIIMNSVKFSPKQSIINIDVNSINNDMIEIKIRDEGIGISDSDIDKIFDPFFRNEKSIGIIPGSGLGLAIVDKCVKLMNGEITVNNKLDKGTLFTITLPKKNTVQLS